MTKTMELSVFLHPKQAKQSKKEEPTASRGGTAHPYHIRQIHARGKSQRTGQMSQRTGKSSQTTGLMIKNMGNKRKIQTQNGEKQVSKQKATSHKKERKQA